MLTKDKNVGLKKDVKSPLQNVFMPAAYPVELSSDDNFAVRVHMFASL